MFCHHYSQLLRNPQVLFAGYKVPHPLEHKFVLRIQTTPDYTPQEALTMAIQDLLAEVNIIETRFKVNNYFIQWFIYCIYQSLFQCAYNNEILIWFIGRNKGKTDSRMIINCIKSWYHLISLYLNWKGVYVLCLVYVLLR